MYTTRKNRFTRASNRTVNNLRHFQRSHCRIFCGFSICGILRFSLVFAAVTVLNFGPARASGIPRQPDATGKVIKIYNNGSIGLENGQSYRLWGVLPQSGYVTHLRETLLGETVRCYFRRNLAFMLGAGKVTVFFPNVVTCYRQGGGGFFPDSLAGETFKAGVARPFCPEAYTFYPSCVDEIK